MHVTSFNSYDDAHLLETHAVSAFRAVLSEYGRGAPALSRVTVLEGRPRDFEFVAEFVGGAARIADRHWLVPKSQFSPQGRIDVLHPRVELDLRSLYSRLFEDHMIELDLRVAREIFMEVVNTTRDPETISSARQVFGQQQDMIRRAHRGALSQNLYLRGIDRASLDDVVHIDWSQMASTIVETPALQNMTATQMAAVQAELSHRLTRMADAVMMQHVSVYADAIRDAAIFGSGFTRFMVNGDVGDDHAQAKGLALLKDWLSPEQRASYETHQHFEVKGGTTGKRYRIRHGRQMNIDELDANGNMVSGWCFLPEGQLVAGDVMLAQKLALECDELDALKVANHFPGGFSAGGGYTTSGIAYSRGDDSGGGGAVWVDITHGHGGGGAGGTAGPAGGAGGGGGGATSQAGAGGGGAGGGSGIAARRLEWNVVSVV